ncbi:MAG: hypothetical protein ABIZ71_04495 [Gemmatimonadales bacterium]
MLVAALALGAVWREAARARAASVAEADRRAAVLVAEYLSAVASPGSPGRTGADARLLSAAGALVSASFWSGGAQVWLDRTPLLLGDTSGTGAAVAPLVNPDGALRGAVAVWRSVPTAGEEALVAVSGTLALAAIIAATLVGAYTQRPRERGVLTGVTLAVVAVGIAGQVGAIVSADRAATDAGLLRTRRVLEIAAVGARVPPRTVTRLAPGLQVTPVRAAVVVRDSGVTRDTSGAWVVALASRGQAWRLVDPGSARAKGPIRSRIVLFGLVALLATFAAAALPAGEGYLTASRPDPRPFA